MLFNSKLFAASIWKKKKEKERSLKVILHVQKDENWKSSNLMI